MRKIIKYNDDLNMKKRQNLQFCKEIFIFILGQGSENCIQDFSNYIDNYYYYH